jgi:hypothetical protein
VTDAPMLELDTYYLIGNASAGLSSAPSYDQIATSSGIEIGRIDGVRKFMFGVGHIGS